MKRFNYLLFSTIATLFTISLAGCNKDSGGGSTPSEEFSFNIVFDSTRTDTIYKGENETLRVIESNPGTVERNYTFAAVGDPTNEYIDVTKDAGGKSATVNPKKKTEGDDRVGVRVTETTSNIKRTIYFTIAERHDLANTGYNFSSKTGDKTKILAELEKYAMTNYLTGITLFENGGYIRYSPRVHTGAQDYVTGYGFGLLAEGYLDDSWTPSVSKNSDYLRSATSSDPATISGWDATGSQVGDLFGYISSSYWGTKLNAKADGYDWYPVLAADDCPDPIAMDVDPSKPDVTIHKQWRVYVKTGDIKYRTNSTNEDIKKYDGRPVALEDYEFTFKLLLTQGGSNSGLYRGKELATDTSYGFRGAYTYFKNTKTEDMDVADAAWETFKSGSNPGIKTGHDDKGDYIQFEFINPIDQFTAKYTLASSLYTPMPEDFLKEIGGGNWILGGKIFGTVSGSSIMDHTLCIGPYFLEDWHTDQEIVFQRNDDWYEYKDTKGTEHPRYRIPGVHMLVVSAAQQKDDAIYDQFNSGILDSTGIPASRMSERVSTDRKTKGDATFKLNVNSCTQERWDELFWSNKYPDVAKPTKRYNVKPWMSNINFLNGLFWSINRKEFADQRGVNPSYSYFADSYLSDPVNGVSYNSTNEHKTIAEDGFDPALRTSNYGYNKAKAIEYFKIAVNELINEGAITRGTASNPTKIKINIEWMYQNDETTYGQNIANYFTEAFNDEDVSGGTVLLEVTHNAGSDWQQVYNDHLMVGDFDLGFGAISGNSLNPLNFMEVLKSDNSSGFTLNWGPDTSKVDPVNPIVYGNEDTGGDKEWSFDALWAAADHGAIVKDGEAKDSVSYGYLESPKSIAEPHEPVNSFENGAIVTIQFAFIDIDEGATFDITRIQLYLAGAGSIELTNDKYRLIKNAKGQVTAIEITINGSVDPVTGDESGFAKEVNDALFEGLKLQKQIDALDKSQPDYDEKVYELKHPFTYANYGMYWVIEIYYNIEIAGSVPTENVYTARKNEEQIESLRFGFASL